MKLQFERPQTINLDLSFLVKAELHTDGANVHEMRRQLQLYVSGIELWNHHVERGGPITPDIVDKREQSRQAEEGVRRTIAAVEMEKLRQNSQAMEMA
jgi:hypothetical protein